MLVCNLLPWRESQQRKRHKFYFFIYTVVVILFLALSCSLHLWLTSKTDYYQHRLLYFTDRRNIVKSKAAKILTENKSRARVKSFVLMTHKSNKSFFAALIKFFNVLPDGIYFSDLVIAKNKWSVTGISDSPNVVHQFVAVLHHDCTCFTNIRLHELKMIKGKWLFNVKWDMDGYI